MMLTQGVLRLSRRVHRRVPALLDRLEIWDTPVTHGSRLGLLALIKDLRDGATHYTLCLGCCDSLLSILIGNVVMRLVDGRRWLVVAGRRFGRGRPHASPVVLDDDDLAVEDPGQY